MMRFGLTVFAMAISVLMAAMAMAQPSRSEAITGVIGDQLEDFTARDLDGAFDHASRNIQGLFGNPENFGRMVEQGYPMVWDHAGVRFLGLREVGEAWFQTVLLRDPRGVPHLLEYRMIETPQGWRIDGVSLLAGPEVGA